MRRTRRLLFIGGAACVLVACNLIAGFESEYSVGEVTPPSEGGPDGATEAATDGPVGTDSPIESATDGGTDATFSCPVVAPPKQIFCDDFEGEAGAPNFNWSGRDESTAGGATTSITRDVGTGVGGSSSLKIELAQSGGSPYVRLRRAMAPVNPHQYPLYEAEFDFRIANATPDYIALAMITFPAEPAADREHGAGLYGPDVLSVMKPGVQLNGVTDTKGWHHGKITVTSLSPTTVQRVVWIDTTKVDDSPGHPLAAGTTTGGTDFNVGIFNIGVGAGTTTIYFDNVVLRRE